MSNRKVFMWTTENDAGTELLDKFVRPLVKSLGAELEMPEKSDDRRRMVKALRSNDAVIIDGSVEDGHVYHKFVELVKTSNNAVLCSRTALPRNVYAFHQCAPPHGERFTNDLIAAYLSETLPQILAVEYSNRGYFEQMFKSIDEQKQQMISQTGLFVSYRGTHEKKAHHLRRQVADLGGVSARVVPRGQYAYEAECMTRQRMWEVVALLEREISSAPGVIALLSDDYFDSFWTCSEILIMQYHRLRTDYSVYEGFAVDEGDIKKGSLKPMRFGIEEDEVPVPVIGEAERYEYRRLLRQADPGTVAPEMKRENSGLIGIFFKTLYAISGHNASPQDEPWWNDVMVQCAACKPNCRKPEEIDWLEHLACEGYGYFTVSKNDLRTGAELKCETCGSVYAMVNKREPRTYWIPGPLGRLWTQDMEMIEEQPIWEIETVRRR